MSEIAHGYVTLIPQLKSGGIRSALEGASPDAARAGAKLGKTMSSSLGAGLGGIVKGVGKFAVAAAGTASALMAPILSKGWTRAINIENAEAKLKGLGHSAGAVRSIMDGALASVKGTAYGLDEAATTAAGAIASGVKPGADLERTLKLVADAATIAGTDMGSMGAIFNKVAAGGVIQGEEIAQLSDRGIPILQLLADQLGVTSEEAKKMASEGKISFDTFRDAMEKGMGGAALKSGDTVSGALQNVSAALGRLGEGAIKPFMPFVKQLADGLIKLADTVGPKVKGFASHLASGLGAVVEKIKAFASSSGIGGVAAAIAPALPVLGALLGALGGLASNLPLVGRLFLGITGPVGLVVGMVGALVAASPALRSALGGALTEIGKVVLDVAKDFAPIVSSLMPALSSVLSTLGGAIAPIITFLADGLAQILPAITQSVGQIVGAVAPLVAVLTPIIGIVGNLISALLPPLMGLVQALIPVITTIAGVIVSAVGGVTDILTTLTPVLEFLADVIATVLTVALTVLTGVINVVVAVVQAIIAVFTDWEGTTQKVSDFIKSAWESVKAKAQEIWDSLCSFLASIPGRIMEGLSSLGQLAGKAAAWFQGVGQAASEKFTQAVEFIRGIPGKIFNGLQALGQLAGQAAQWFFGFLQAAQNRLGEAVAWVGGIPGRILGALGNLGSLLADAGASIIQGFLRGLRSAFESVKNFVSGIGSWIASHKGPKDYDLALLVPAGQWIMTGLREGLSSQIPALRQDLSGISRELEAGLDVASNVSLSPGGLPGAGGRAGNAGGVTVNQYIQTATVPAASKLESDAAASARIWGALGVAV